MNKFPSVVLMLLGSLEVFWGLFGGRIQVYFYEAPFSHELGYPNLSAAQIHGFNKYIGIYKDQWQIVACFGLATIVLGVFLYFNRPPDKKGK
jgi:hypothetical protein